LAGRVESAVNGADIENTAVVVDSGREYHVVDCVSGGAQDVA